MLYTKYEISGPCSFRQKDVLTLHFENIFLPHDLLMQPTGTVWTTLVEEHSCEVWSKSNEWFQRRSCLNEKVYACTDGRRTKDCHNSSLWAHSNEDTYTCINFCNKWLNKAVAFTYFYRGWHQRECVVSADRPPAAVRPLGTSEIQPATNMLTHGENTQYMAGKLNISTAVMGLHHRMKLVAFW